MHRRSAGVFLEVQATKFKLINFDEHAESVRCQFLICFLALRRFLRRMTQHDIVVDTPETDE